MADDTGANTDLDDVRIRTRAAMGECQGGRCCHTIATELFPVEEIETIDSALDTLAAGRWTGQRDCLWGDQLAEAMRNYERHVGDLNRDADHDSVDFTAFDSGPEWAEDDVNPRGGGFKP
jgi:glycerol-3-phosphate dehydrogenase